MEKENDRIPVIDDDTSILETYRNIPAPERSDHVVSAGAVLFEDIPAESAVDPDQYALTLCHVHGSYPVLLYGSGSEKKGNTTII
jgi:hypothetical protein